LPFKKGEILTIKDSREDPNWWQAEDAGGKQGFIPSNYVETLAKAEVGTSLLSRTSSTQQSDIETVRPVLSLQSDIPLFFHGSITSAQASDLINGKPEGSFLMRFSSARNGFTLHHIPNGMREGRAVRILTGSGGGGFHIIPTVRGYATPWELNGFNNGSETHLRVPVNRTSPLAPGDALLAQQLIARQPPPMDVKLTPMSGSGKLLPKKYRGNVALFRKALPELQATPLGKYLLSKKTFDSTLVEEQLAMVEAGQVLGASIHCVTNLSEFLVKEGRHTRDGALTTGELVDLLVKPTTAAVELPLFVLFLGLRGPNLPLLNPASTFVSHTWQAPFNGLHTGLNSYDLAKTSQGSTPYYWIDLLCKNQHRPAPDLGEFEAAIACTRETVVTLGGITEAVSLRRIWCLYEMHLTLALGSSLGMQLPDAPRLKSIDLDDFQAAMGYKGATPGEVTAAKGRMVSKLAEQVDLRTATASRPEDVAMIMAQIEAGVGSQRMEAELKRAIKDYGLSLDGTSH